MFSPPPTPTPTPAPVINEHAPANAQQQIPVWAYVLCGWPFALVFLGGLIGGIFGGLAFAANMTVFRSNMPMAARIGISQGIGVAAVVLYFVVALLFFAATQ